MRSTATEAAASLQRNSELAIRLSSAQSHAATRQGGTPQNQMSADITARAVPRKTSIPRHPIPSMQEAFAESLAEVTSGTLSLKPKLAVDSAQARRARLIDQDKSEGPPAALWRYRPGQNCHELRKLIAQIAFGVYLLLKGMANNNAQVVAILQGHIDEVDEYLRTAMDDLTLANQDLATRLEHLRLPLSDLPAFEDMLEDRAFRLRIVEGNVRIEHILSRTGTALLQATEDINEGLRSTKDFNAYLSSESQGPWHADADVADIYEAMRGNAEGWLNAFTDMEEKSHTLGILIAKLAEMVTKMDNCAGEFTIQPYTLPEDDVGQTYHISQISEGSQESSNDSSHETTPPDSPGAQAHVPQEPPRLSLRLSVLDSSSLTADFLDLGSRNSLFGGDAMFSTWTPTSGTEERNNAAIQAEKADDQRPHELAIMLDAGPGTEFHDRRSSPGGREENGGERIDTDAADAYDLDIDDDNLSSIPLRIDIDSPKPVPKYRAPSPAALGQATAVHLRPGTGRSHDGGDRQIPHRQLSMRSPVPSESSSRRTETSGTPSRKRTSLRERISLRTAPPEAILVPAPNAPLLQRPVFASPRTYQNYRTFTGPDSANSTDPERTLAPYYADEVVHPKSSAGAEFNPPVFPGILPSPHSDQQFFRPVQASPHSPLQQRPHTAGQVPMRSHHLRNAPSSMGMSTLSSVTTMTQDSEATRRTVKKKRSAFGWLKKAFTLDDDERAEFDQRKKQAQQNAYFESHSKGPKFLDGRRVR
ncbi:hypothetical protein CMQ_1928 [Grosmannia clavigera kw1407]|uniref:Uncharacterized protein n=1 Tax=Grosmannia clavigera (strain kw1407 / UAMH 11150) TaxID=655863 RepID=F0XN34_GROCL|nr:uncharacterized protein CMQ_1928 [Grosmannia clavigera kw1407]EFX00847.1 hypothetical protein CMQ_1928 [Grosmannia clavigera kw1407]